MEVPFFCVHLTDAIDVSLVCKACLKKIWQGVLLSLICCYYNSASGGYCYGSTAAASAVPTLGACYALVNWVAAHAPPVSIAEGTWGALQGECQAHCWAYYVWLQVPLQLWKRSQCG